MTDSDDNYLNDLSKNFSLGIFWFIFEVYFILSFTWLCTKLLSSKLKKIIEFGAKYKFFDGQDPKIAMACNPKKYKLYVCRVSNSEICNIGSNW